MGISGEQLQKTPLDDSQRQGIVVLHDAATTLLALVNDLLDLARIDSGKLELRLQAVGLEALLDRALSLLRPAAVRKGLELSVHLGPEAPLAIVTDSLRLGQVLLNLLGNAIKFTDRGTVRLLVERLPQADGMAKLRFSVIDTGIGIPTAEQERIFESFTQVDASPNRARGGVGLGLAIARRLVELLGGALELESESGRGSRFSFTLNCHVADSSQSPACWDDDGWLAGSSTAEYAANRAPAPTGAKGGAILVVDDAAANRYLAATMLRGAGYAVDVASSGPEAMQSVATRTYQAILLDVHMPGMNGFEVARAVRQFEADHNRGPTRIVGLTADATSETGTRLLRKSIDFVLHKPASEEAILAAIAAGSSPRPWGGESAASAGNPCEDSLTGQPLARLRGDRALLAELAVLFAREAALQRVCIEDGLRSADARKVWHASHRLRGQAMMFDATELCQVLRQVEELASVGRLQSCREVWSAAAEQLESLCDALSSKGTCLVAATVE